MKNEKRVYGYFCPYIEYIATFPRYKLIDDLRASLLEKRNSMNDDLFLMFAVFGLISIFLGVSVPLLGPITVFSSGKNLLCSLAKINISSFSMKIIIFSDLFLGEDTKSAGVQEKRKVWTKMCAVK